MSVLLTGRRAPPALPLDGFGPFWSDWITTAAEGAAAPADYVTLPLLATASALIGNARWAQATPAWREPPHLWCAVVGDSGNSKSPGADCLLRDVVPALERRMLGDFPERLRDWKAASEEHKARTEVWQTEVRQAAMIKTPPPLPPQAAPPEPQVPRLRQSDVTIEKLAVLLASAAPKGVLVTRDELSGWLLGMNTYSDAGRAFWIEANGGRPYRVERQKHPEPIDIPRLAVAVTGGTQPDKLVDLFKDPDDGLLARFCWGWPDAVPFKLGQSNPHASEAIDALDRLRGLDLAAAGIDGETAAPVMVPLSPEARAMLEKFGQDMQALQSAAGGLMRSAYGKARGLALRLSLVMTMLRWCASCALSEPPTEISDAALAAACDLVADYFMPMAERVFGDAGAPAAERNAATLAKWIERDKPFAVHARTLQREIRLPGLRTAESIHAAAAVLVEADWLRAPPRGGFQDRARVAYPVNPALLGQANG